MQLGARIVVAGTSSGVGKTTVATGVMAALRRRGIAVSSAKVGPDFIDPGYHGLATGRPGRNLDAWICGEAVLAQLAARAARDTEILVVEGVMGLFDGAGSTDEASTAHVAKLLAAPVLLVVDASAMSGSVAALVHGFATWDPAVSVGGVILNRVGSPGHEELLRQALQPLALPVLGALPRDDRLTWRDRHLGLVPVAEHPAQVAASIDRLADVIDRSCDVDAIVALARQAPPRTTLPPPAARPVGRCRIAVAAGQAFTFMYPENRELLAEAGAELVDFDPLTASELPADIDGLVAGGGFPEVFAPALAANAPLLSEVRKAMAGGLVTWAECGGLLWLARRLDGHQLAGVVDAEGAMSTKLTLGYREATTLLASPFGPPGTSLRGHEFHYSSLEPQGTALDLVGRFGRGRSGWASATMLASYLHLHLANAPQLAERFVGAAVAQRARRPSGRAPRDAR